MNSNALLSKLLCNDEKVLIRINVDEKENAVLNYQSETSILYPGRVMLISPSLLERNAVKYLVVYVFSVQIHGYTISYSSGVKIFSLYYLLSKIK